MQMHTNIGVTEKKEGGKGCIYNRTTGMVVWVKGLNLAACTCKSIPKEISLNEKYNREGRNPLILP